MAPSCPLCSRMAHVPSWDTKSLLHSKLVVDTLYRSVNMVSAIYFLREMLMPIRPVTLTVRWDSAICFQCHKPKAPSLPLLCGPCRYNATTAKLAPTGDHARDTLVSERLAVRSESER